METSKDAGEAEDGGAGLAVSLEGTSDEMGEGLTATGFAGVGAGGSSTGAGARLAAGFSGTGLAWGLGAAVCFTGGSGSFSSRA